MSETVDVITPSALTQADKAAWMEMRAGNPALYSPYFHVDYTQIIGELRGDAYVARVSRDGKLIAFLPFQGPRPGKGGFARPIGAPMTDYHGFIAAPSTKFDPAQIMRRAGIGAFHYGALVDAAGNISPSSQEVAAVMFMPQGVESWRRSRDPSYNRHLKSHRRRVRKAEEDIGPRTFNFKSRDQATFDQLITWKREKFAQTGKYDVLSADWTMALLKRLWTSEGPLRCEMHSLHFGDKLAAIDLGLTDGETFHSWIVAYDNELHHYAPGIQLLEELIDASEDLGYKRIDLGAGIDGYKRHYTSENFQVGSGFIAAKGPAAALSQIYDQAERFGKKSLGDVPGKLRRRYSQIAACDDSFSGRAKAMLQAVKTSQT